jgi:phage FluMu gp28-like protein
MPRAISKATWDQIKIARAAGASYGELAEKTGISKGTILAHESARLCCERFPRAVQNISRTRPNAAALPAKWVQDDSRLKLCVKSRQIGLSWCTAYRVVRQKVREKTRQDAWISSRDEIQAGLFLADARRWTDILNVAAVDLGNNVIDDEGHTAYTLRFANGVRIFSLSSNPDAQAGKRGDRICDEFALHPDPRKLYSIAYPGITWGGCLEIFSSHRGSANYFNELVREICERNNPKDFSFHRVTHIHQNPATSPYAR